MITRLLCIVLTLTSSMVYADDAMCDYIGLAGQHKIKCMYAELYRHSMKLTDSPIKANGNILVHTTFCTVTRRDGLWYSLPISQCESLLGYYIRELNELLTLKGTKQWQ